MDFTLTVPNLLPDDEAMLRLRLKEGLAGYENDFHRASIEEKPNRVDLLITIRWSKDPEEEQTVIEWPGAPRSARRVGDEAAARIRAACEARREAE